MGQDMFKKFFLKILLQLVIVTFVVFAHSQPEDFDPEFLAPLENSTATQGRDVSFTCVVNDLGPYKVAWIKSDSKTILAIHTHMVAVNHRLSVTHNGHNTWKLHIAHVQLNDSGSYMCQVNTDPMRSQSGHLDVVVSPDILNGPESNSATLSEEGLINEGGHTQLLCSATGVPEPTVQWRREDGKDIVLRSADGREKQSVKFVDGERLILQQVQRTDMGGYLCIASNGVPPSVSKRFDVQVMFPPTIKAVTNIVSTPSGGQVLLQCIVEVSPKPLNGWYRNDGGVKLHDGQKYLISEGMINAYTWQMNLTIRNLQKHDFGLYMCSSINAMGKQDDRIRINEIFPVKVETTTAQPFVPHTTPKPPRRKSHQSHKTKGGHEATRTKGDVNVPNQVQENEIVGGLGTDEAKTSSSGPNGLNGGNSYSGGVGGASSSSSSSSGGPNAINSSGNSINGGSGGGSSGGSNGIEKTRNAQAKDPSQKPPWILHSSSNIQSALRTKYIIWVCCLVSTASSLL